MNTNQSKRKAAFKSAQAAKTKKPAYTDKTQYLGEDYPVEQTK